MFEKMLVPLDGSKIAEQVFPYVISIAKAFSSEVVAVSVCEPDNSDSGHACHLYINGQVDLLKDKLATATNVKVSSVILSGKAAEQILDYAENNDVNLILMASHGRSGFGPWSLGSTVDKVLHKVNRPLMIIRAKEKAKEPSAAELFKQILSPVDGTESCEVVLPYLTAMNQKMNSQVTLLQVLAEGKHVHTVGGIDFVYFKDHDMSSTKIKAQEYLQEKIQQLDIPARAKKSEIKYGDPAQEIIKYAKGNKTPFIALSTHGHTGIERWAYGSVTYKVLQTAADKSFLLIPALEASH